MTEEKEETLLEKEVAKDESEFGVETDVTTPDSKEETASNEEADQVETVDDELTRLRAEQDVLADRVLRAQAELQNVQKRQAKERADLLKYRSQKLAEALLPVVDSLENALKIEVNDEASQSLKKGIEMAYNTFIQALKEEGVEKIEALNQPFDPTKHQAIQQVESEDAQKETVVQVYQEGYSLHDRVIRPAMVVVTA